VTSIYRWQERVDEEGEQLLVIKTVEANLDALRDALFARHPYDVPEFVVLPVASTSEAYGAWLLESTARRGKDGGDQERGERREGDVAASGE